MSEHAKDLNEKYVRKDVHEIEMGRVKDLCVEKHKVVDFRIKALEEAMKSYNRKMTASLIFAIMTLVAIIVAIGTRALT